MFRSVHERTEEASDTTNSTFCFVRWNERNKKNGYSLERGRGERERERGARIRTHRAKLKNDGRILLLLLLTSYSRVLTITPQTVCVCRFPKKGFLNQTPQYIYSSLFEKGIDPPTSDPPTSCAHLFLL